MNKKTVSIIILVAGIVLLFLGFNDFGTFGSRAGRLLGAGLTNKALFFFIAGAACTGYGLLHVLKKK